MSKTLELVLELVTQRQVVFSSHGYDELAADNILICDIVSGIADAVIIEDYPEYHKGPCILVLQKDGVDSPIHVVWGIPKGKLSPAVVVTAYRPDSKRWSSNFLRRI